jgi:type II secretory pathway component PulC
MKRLTVLIVSLLFLETLATADTVTPCEIFQKELKAVRWVPFVSDGVVKGWAIREVERAPQLQKRGLRERDLVIKIYRTELSSPENLQLALEQMCSRRSQMWVTRRKKSFAIDLW